MEYLLTAEEMRRMDAETTNRLGIPALVLMERAALSVYEELEKAIKCEGEKTEGREGVRNARQVKKVLILAGGGNNGADGLALARLLAERNAAEGADGKAEIPVGASLGCFGDKPDFQVEVVVCADPQKVTPQWKTQYEILSHFPVETGCKPKESEYDILIDALFGVGLSREVTGKQAELIRWFNERKGWKVAVDVPSGIHSDSGRVMGCAVKADLTVCFAYGKRGLYFYPGCEYAGKVVVKNIGIGPLSFGGLTPGMFRYTEEPAKLLPLRRPDGNKGTFGKVLLAAGNRNMAGAAVLAARACCGCGTGMVKVLSHRENRIILQTAVPEALFGTEEDLTENTLLWPNVLAVGPGLGTDAWAYGLLDRFLTDSRLPLVIDADGLNLLSSHRELFALMGRQAGEGRRIVLTPHVGELARLCGRQIGEVKERPVEIASGLARELGCIVVSKDARTLICREEGAVCLNTSGNSGMAAAGSGDVLTGVVAGLLAQGMDAFDAACIGVYVHGLAGDRAALLYGERGMTASSLVEALPSALETGLG